MLSAAEIRNCTLSNSIVETEISLLNLNILLITDDVTVAVNKDTETDVNNVTVTGTPMTSDSSYYDVWQNIITDNFKSSEMQKVIDYFTKLGYTINRKSEDSEYIFWQISW